MAVHFPRISRFTPDASSSILIAAPTAGLEATSLPCLPPQLELRDPAIFARIDRKNPRRVMRALEVIRLTGRPFSAQRAPWNRNRRAARREQGTGKRELFFGLAR